MRVRKRWTEENLANQNFNCVVRDMTSPLDNRYLIRIAAYGILPDFTTTLKHSYTCVTIYSHGLTTSNTELAECKNSSAQDLPNVEPPMPPVTMTSQMKPVLR